MNDLRVYFDRIPGRDQYALYVLRGGGVDRARLEPDGSWREFLGNDPAPTLVIDGLTWRELRAPLTKALGGVPEGTADTEVRVLREWLAVERARVERGFRP